MIGILDRHKSETPAPAAVATVAADEVELSRLRQETDRLMRRQQELQGELTDLQSQLDNMTISDQNLQQAEQAYVSLTSAMAARRGMQRTISMQLPPLLERLAIVEKAYKRERWLELGDVITAKAEQLAIAMAALSLEAAQLDELTLQRDRFSHKQNPYNVREFAGVRDQLAGMAATLSPAAKAKWESDLKASVAHMHDVMRQQRREARRQAHEAFVSGYTDRELQKMGMMREFQDEED